MSVEFFEWFVCIVLVMLALIALAEIFLLFRYVAASDQILELAKGWYRMTVEKHEDTHKVADAISRQSTATEAVQKLPEIVGSLPEKTAVKVVEKIKEERGDSLPGVII